MIFGVGGLSVGVQRMEVKMNESKRRRRVN